MSYRGQKLQQQSYQVIACRTQYHILYSAEEEPEIKGTLQLASVKKRHLIENMFAKLKDW